MAYRGSLGRFKGALRERKEREIAAREAKKSTRSSSDSRSARRSLPQFNTSTIKLEAGGKTREATVYTKPGSKVKTPSYAAMKATTPSTASAAKASAPKAPAVSTTKAASVKTPSFSVRDVQTSKASSAAPKAITVNKSTPAPQAKKREPIWPAVLASTIAGGVAYGALKGPKLPDSRIPTARRPGSRFRSPLALPASTARVPKVNRVTSPRTPLVIDVEPTPVVKTQAAPKAKVPKAKVAPKVVTPKVVEVAPGVKVAVPSQAPAAKPAPKTKAAPKAKVSKAKAVSAPAAPKVEVKAPEPKPATPTIKTIKATPPESAAAPSAAKAPKVKTPKAKAAKTPKAAKAASQPATPQQAAKAIPELSASEERVFSEKAKAQAKKTEAVMAREARAARIASPGQALSSKYSPERQKQISDFMKKNPSKVQILGPTGGVETRKSARGLAALRKRRAEANAARGMRRPFGSYQRGFAKYLPGAKYGLAGVVAGGLLGAQEARAAGKSGPEIRKAAALSAGESSFGAAGMAGTGLMARYGKGVLGSVVRAGIRGFAPFGAAIGVSDVYRTGKAAHEAYKAKQHADLHKSASRKFIEATNIKIAHAKERKRRAAVKKNA